MHFENNTNVKLLNNKHSFVLIFLCSSRLSTLSAQARVIHEQFGMNHFHFAGFDITLWEINLNTIFKNSGELISSNGFKDLSELKCVKIYESLSDLV